MTKTILRMTALAALIAVAGTACGAKKPPVPNAPPPAAGPSSFPSSSGGGATTPAPPVTPPLPPLIEDTPVVSRPAGDWSAKPVEAINAADGPLRPIFFLYDSDELDDAARKLLSANAEVLKAYPTWAVTIEGHCDERGSAEYNLALGDRRALVTKSYLQSMGISAERLRTVSYGKEFPFDPGQSEAAYAQNRRAQLMVTSK